MKKYEFTGETKTWLGGTLHRIKAVISFGSVQAGELGGWIEKESNLDHVGDAWVYGNALVYGNAEVSGRKHILWVSMIGSRDDTVTFMRSKEKKIIVVTGCFLGNIDEFEKSVKETHGDNEHAKAYMLAIELAKLRIDLSGEVEEEGGE